MLTLSSPTVGSAGERGDDPPATGREVASFALFRLSGTLRYPVPLLGPGILVFGPVDRVGEGQRLHRSGRVEGRKRGDLVGQLDLGRIERGRIVLSFGDRDGG